MGPPKIPKFVDKTFQDNSKKKPQQRNQHKPRTNKCKPAKRKTTPATTKKESLNKPADRKIALTFQDIATLKQNVNEEDRNLRRMEAAAILSKMTGKKLSLKQSKQQQNALVELHGLRSDPDPFSDPENDALLGEAVSDDHIIVAGTLSNLPPIGTPNRSRQCTPIANYIGCLAASPGISRTPATTPTSGLPFSFRPRDEVLRYNHEHRKAMNSRPEKTNTSTKCSQKISKVSISKLQQQLQEAIKHERSYSDSDFSFQDKESESD